MTASFSAEEAGTRAWDDLTQRLEQFLAAWAEQEAPRLAEFLPAEPPGHRVLVLKELVKVDLEERSTRSLWRTLEEYTAEFPELIENGEPPHDLIYEEYHLRRGAGHDVSPQDYFQKYPRAASALKRMMGGTESLTATTQVFTARRIEGFAPGQKLDEFELMLELGKGAFGSVFLARQTTMNRLVALKVSADKGNEQKTLGALDHPNIVRVYDQRHLADQRLRLVFMQLAPGGTLADLVKDVRATPPAARSGALLTTTVNRALEKTGLPAAEETTLKRRMASASWAETVCRLGVQLAQGLDYAHKQGVLHRDVKPANILLAGDGSPKIADFNISFCSQLDGASPAAYFGGSLAYMSPEQLEACNPAHQRQPDDLDGRSDLYALGVVLWELLYGERPFDDKEGPGGWTGMLQGMVERRKQHSLQAPPAAQRDALTQRLEQVLRKVMSPSPDHRHADGGALARDLMLCLNPRAWDLVHELQSGWRNWARQHPILALFPVNLPPFALASFYNYFYNKQVFVTQLNAEQRDVFHNMVPLVNGVLFPVGIFIILWYAWPIARGLRALVRGESSDVELLRRARRHCVWLGITVALVGMALWAVAGLSFPTGIMFFAEPSDDSKNPYPHFLLSMFTCGMISCCFPFLASTWLSVRIFLPALLGSTPPEPSEQRSLMLLARYAGWSVVLSAIVPMLGVLLLPGSGEEGRLFTILLIIAGLAGFGASYFTLDHIRRDLTALTIATRPVDMLGVTTDTVDTF